MRNQKFFQRKKITVNFNRISNKDQALPLGATPNSENNSRDGAVLQTQQTFSETVAAAITPEKEMIDYKFLLEEYKIKHSERIQKLTEDYNFKLKEKELGYETRVAEQNEEYELRISELRERVKNYGIILNIHPNL